MTPEDDNWRKLRLLQRVEDAAYAQRENARMLRALIADARRYGASWREVAAALGISTPTALRQYKAGSPIVVVRPYQKGGKGDG